jgi:hypothetical protein
MDIFVLDKNIEKCAQYHCDQHVVKMILEIVQMLCTAQNKKGITTPCKSTHQNHPCVLHEISNHDYEKRGLTEFAQAMRETYKVPGDAVRACRQFYLGEKMAFAKWTKRSIPDWVRDHLI